MPNASLDIGDVLNDRLGYLFVAILRVVQGI
jgi:hypothetical protein